MTNTFVNPVINPDSQLGIDSFEDTGPVRLWSNPSSEELDIAIRAAYKQILGNAHVMESERLIVQESRLRQGEINIREFVRQIALGGLYRSRFFDSCPRNRFIELNFKHLLGRAPQDYQEIAVHSQLLDSSSYEAEINSYIDSDEYLSKFGDNIVPYYQGYRTQNGQKIVEFTHMFQLLRGSCSSDKDIAYKNRARLNHSIMSNQPSQIKPVTGSPVTSKGYKKDTDANALIAKVLKLNKKQVISPQPTSQTESKFFSMDITKQQQFYQAYQPFKETEPLELYPNSSLEEVDIAIRAIYRQVLGNAYVMESEKLVIPESQLKQGDITVREFVRQVARSGLYRSRFFDNCYRYRAIELNFKHLLGRAPDNFEEMRYHSDILDNGGFGADIDSYIDSNEYQDNFGEYIVPYYRGYRSQNGQSMIGFTNLFQLLRSSSSSDKELTKKNSPKLTRSLILKRAYGIDKVRDASEILAEVFKSKPKDEQKQKVEANKFTLAQIQEQKALEAKVKEQDNLIAQLQDQLADLKPFANIAAAGFSQIISYNQSATATTVSNPTKESTSNNLQMRSQEQEKIIAYLREQITDSRALASIGEYRANKWRSRTFN
ncbi:MAG: phycobilisome rod-core linker polypeptide [Cyanobacteria bacterium P01_A01_bin.84]